MLVPGTGITGPHYLPVAGPDGQPPGWGLHTSPDGRPICVEHHPAGCRCLSDRPLALLYVRRQAAVVNGRTVARRRLARCHQAADGLGAHVLGCFVDDGSAAAPERPGLDALLASVSLLAEGNEVWSAQPVTYVITAQADQLARSTATWQRITQALADIGARLVFANEALS